MSFECVVSTKKQLDDAVKKEIQNIIVEGELAEDVYNASALKNCSKEELAAIAQSSAFFNPIEVLVGNTVAGLIGTDFSSMMVVEALGIPLAFIIAREYDIVEFSGDKGKDKFVVKLRRKRELGSGATSPNNRLNGRT